MSCREQSRLLSAIIKDPQGTEVIPLEIDARPLVSLRSVRMYIATSCSQSIDDDPLSFLLNITASTGRRYLLPYLDRDPARLGHLGNFRAQSFAPFLEGADGTPFGR